MCMLKATKMEIETVYSVLNIMTVIPVPSEESVALVPYVGGGGLPSRGAYVSMANSDSQESTASVCHVRPSRLESTDSLADSLDRGLEVGSEDEQPGGSFSSMVDALLGEDRLTT